ncbi:hypothetical protein Belba_2302 [Belliella baltica DSM 15883]|uniref:Uncharacterized protein n=1 Tax=Belliella baltica (strain DSM 15883 / CIP 108006 / LMG 21964 / BA134) TaxID=866536 RepID=I3Z6J8_BELBD|nr:hypothetical protein [Belliella baltica]AFL84866.1 hypothetical protein Belba_2302 [Belliella baltica DSM 15883]
MYISRNFKPAFFIVLFLLFAVSFVQAQDTPARLTEFNQVRIDYNKSGMIILGSWALGNIALGGFMAGRTSGETKAFHQMNIYWNTVNLAIAGFGYYAALNEIPSSEFWETMHAQNSIEKILLVNAALDLGYMAGGMYLLERGSRLDKEQFKGFGKSVILQGAFLMSFDAIKYVFHNVHGKELPAIMNHIGVTPSGVGLLMNF